MANPVKPLTGTPVPKRLSRTYQRQLRKLVDAHSIERVATAARLDTETITRAIAGMSRTSTNAAIIMFLEAQGL